MISKFAALLYLSALAAPAMADVYMHAPRGSNNRNCRNDNNTNRRNGNRLFDSQNNDKGGYSCPRAYPFACYDGQCNGNGGNNQEAVAADRYGTLTGGNNNVRTNTAQQYYYADSVLPVEWTNQHGCGTNTKVRCRMVIQYACEDTLPELRDGFATKNNSGNNLLDEATDTIPTNAGTANDYRYGRHETHAYYQTCANTQRNKGLYTADQDLNGDTARFTRQNPDGNRNGLECPEESEYHPYWNPSPWKDIAVLTDNLAECPGIVAESQNVKAKEVCQNYAQGGDIPITAAGCAAGGGTWATVPAHGIAAPSCALGPWTRDNHLGNAGVGNVPGQAATFNVTVPKDMTAKGNCVVRLRYNMSSSDTADNSLATSIAQEVPITGTAKDNDAIADRNERENLSYKAIHGYQLGTAVNTNQYGRVFQDRSFTFQVKAAPATGNCANKAIHNLNVRGKRGNIVQTYPSVEYDFMPSVLNVETDDCVHVQFYGSDYNPNRNPNNGEGGPSNPNNNNEAKSDRSNIVPMNFERGNFPQTNTQTGVEYTTEKMFNEDVNAFKKLALLDQDIGGECQTIQQIKQNGLGGNNREARERRHENCAKLSGQKTPAFDGGLLQAGTTGSHAYISTRNNNLTNRGQKGLLNVVSRGQLGSEPGTLPNDANNNFGSAGALGGGDSLILAIAIGGGLVAVGIAFVAYKKMSGGSSAAAPAGAMAAAAPMGGQGTVTARYAHNAKEAGELSFQKGEQITVLRKDASGWWEGQTANGSRGVFPSNYVQ